MCMHMYRMKIGQLRSGVAKETGGENAQLLWLTILVTLLLTNAKQDLSSEGIRRARVQFRDYTPPPSLLGFLPLG